MQTLLILNLDSWITGIDSLVLIIDIPPERKVAYISLKSLFPLY